MEAPPTSSSAKAPASPIAAETKPPTTVGTTVPSEGFHLPTPRLLNSPEVDNITVLLLLVAAFVAIIQTVIYNRSREATKLASIYQSLFLHNNLIITNNKMQLAVDLFRGHKRDDLPVGPDEYQDYYWAARGMHLGHLTILAQVWLLSGQPKEMKGQFANWEQFARAVVDDLSGKTLADKPEWYANACRDFWKEVTAVEAYPPGFIEWSGIRKKNLLKFRRFRNMLSKIFFRK